MADSSFSTRLVRRVTRYSDSVKYWWGWLLWYPYTAFLFAVLLNFFSKAGPDFPPSSADCLTQHLVLSNYTCSFYFSATTSDGSKNKISENESARLFGWYNWSFLVVIFHLTTIWWTLAVWGLVLKKGLKIVASYMPYKLDSAAAHCHPEEECQECRRSHISHFADVTYSIMTSGFYASWVKDIVFMELMAFIGLVGRLFINQVAFNRWNIGVDWSKVVRNVYKMVECEKMSCSDLGECNEESLDPVACVPYLDITHEYLLSFCWYFELTVVFMMLLHIMVVVINTWAHKKDWFIKLYLESKTQQFVDIDRLRWMQELSFTQFIVVKQMAAVLQPEFLLEILYSVQNRMIRMGALGYWSTSFEPPSDIENYSYTEDETSFVNNPDQPQTLGRSHYLNRAYRNWSTSFESTSDIENDSCAEDETSFFNNPEDRSHRLNGAVGNWSTTFEPPSDIENDSCAEDERSFFNNPDQPEMEDRSHCFNGVLVMEPQPSTESQPLEEDEMPSMHISD